MKKGRITHLAYVTKSPGVHEIQIRIEIFDDGKWKEIRHLLSETSNSIEYLANRYEIQLSDGRSSGIFGTKNIEPIGRLITLAEDMENNLRFAAYTVS